MSEMVKGIVACHSGLAPALVAAAEQISGVTGVLLAVSNTDCDRGLIERRLAEAVGGQPAVIFVDMPSGSCFFAAMRQRREHPEVSVVTGVNLPMLVDFVFHRGDPAPDTARRAATKGADGIRQP